MRHPPINSRYATTVTLCSLLLLCAGIAALTTPYGVIVASLLNTITLLVAAVGFAYASNRGLGFGLAALLAAALPLFLVFYGIGHSILLGLGQATAGGLLLFFGTLLACASLWLWLEVGHRSRHSD